MTINLIMYTGIHDEIRKNEAGILLIITNVLKWIKMNTKNKTIKYMFIMDFRRNKK